MTAEFNLSDKIGRFNCVPTDDNWILKKEDVKEFIRLLKEELAKEQENWTNGDGATLISNIIIDKLAGDKLK